MDFKSDKQIKTAVDIIVEQISCIILEMVNRSLEKINDDLFSLNASLKEKRGYQDPEF